MLKTWLSDATIALRQSVETWPQALDICARPLLKTDVIEPAYVSISGSGRTTCWPRDWRCRMRGLRRARRAWGCRC